jgi:ABC-type uncharacterized transport system permease subunit
LPFPAVIYAPARVFVAADAELLTVTLAHQVAWLAVAGLVAGWFFGYAVRRLQANGG